MPTSNKNETMIKKDLDIVSDEKNIKSPSDTKTKSPKTPKAYPKPVINPIKQQPIKMAANGNKLRLIL